MFMKAGLLPHMKPTGLQKVQLLGLSRNSTEANSSRCMVLVGPVSAQAWTLASTYPAYIWFHQYQSDSSFVISHRITQDVTQTATTKK